VSTQPLVWLRGGGDLGTGVAHRLFRAGFPLVVTEIAQPMVVRRAVAFASAVFEGLCEVEGVTAERVTDERAAADLLRLDHVPVLVDPEGTLVRRMAPGILVDARMLKRAPAARLTDELIVIGLGPGFTAGLDADAVIETQRGHDLGRVILNGGAAADTGVPGAVSGYSLERVLFAPCDGAVQGAAAIGDVVQAGQVVALVAGQPVVATLSGVLRGLLHDGISVQKGRKLGDIDPTGVREHCFTISDKARAIGGGVLEAAFYLLHRNCGEWDAAIEPEPRIG
jgi:xanthine dehydrogenase accessory factor